MTMTAEKLTLEWGDQTFQGLAQADRADAQLLAPIDALMSVGQSLLHYRRQLLAGGSEPAADQADFCIGLARAVAGTAERLRAGQEPHSETTAIGAYADSLPSVFEESLGRDVAAELGQRLRAAGRPERFWEALNRADEAEPDNSGDGRQYAIDRLESGAKVFAAVAAAGQPSESKAPLRAAG